MMLLAAVLSCLLFFSAFKRITARIGGDIAAEAEMTSIIFEDNDLERLLAPVSFSSPEYAEFLVSTGCSYTSVSSEYALQHPNDFHCHESLVQSTAGVCPWVKLPPTAYTCLTTMQFLGASLDTLVLVAPQDSKLPVESGVLGMLDLYASRSALRFSGPTPSISTGNGCYTTERTGDGWARAVGRLGVSHSDLVSYDRLPRSIKGPLMATGGGGRILALKA